MMTLKDKIIDFRAMKNLTQIELAKEIGVGRDIITALERETRRCKDVTRRKVEIYIERNSDLR